MKKQAFHLIDFDRVNLLLEGFSKCTGFVAAILDIEGNILSKYGWRRICTDFHRVNSETTLKCTESDTALANKMKAGEKYHFYKCLNGLVDVSVPIIINDEHIANLFTGQFFFEKPDRDFFTKQAEKYGFDKKKYLEALDQVPIVSEEKVKAVMDFLLTMTSQISEMTLQKIEQQNLIDSLQENQDHLSIIFNSNRDLQLLLKYQGPKNFTVVEVNQAYINTCNQYGLNLVVDDFIGLSLADLITNVLGLDDNVLRYTLDNYQKVVDTGQAVKYDESIVVSGKPYHSKITLSPIQKGAKDQQYVVYSSHDVTTEREAHQRLQESDEKYRLIVENLNDLIVKFDKQNLLQYASPNYCKTFGVKEDDIIGTSFLPLIHKDDVERVNQSLATLKNPPHKTFHEERAKTVLGWRWFSWSVKAMTDESGSIVEVVAVGRDISKQKEFELELIKAKEKVEENEARLSSFIENAPDGVFLADENGKYLQVNPAGCDITGYSSDELCNMHMSDLMQPLEMEKGIKHFQDTRDIGSARAEIGFIAKNGENRYWDLSTVKLSDTRFLGFVKDITDRQKIDEERKRNLATLTLGEEIARLGYFESNWQTGDGLWSKGFYRLLGEEPDSVKCTHAEFTTYVHAKDRQRVEQHIKDTLNSHSEMNIEFRLVQANGNVIHIHGIGKNYYDDCGKPLKTVGTFQDVTERIIYENKMKALLDENKVILDNDPAFIIYKDTKNNILRISNTVAEMTGLPKNKIEGKPSAEIYPDMADRYYQDDLKVIKSGQSELNIIEPLTTVKGETSWLLTNKVPVKNNEGVVTGIIVFSTDITKLKEVEQELRQSEEQLKAIFENSLNAILVADDSGNYINVNQAAADMFGYPIEKLRKLNVGDLQTSTAPDAAQRYREYLEKGYEIGEFDFIRKDGQERTAQFHAVRVRDNFHLSILSDITENKNAEAALRESEEKYRVLAENARHLIITHNFSGKITYANPFALQYIDLPLEQLLGLDISQFISGKENAEKLNQRIKEFKSGGNKGYQCEQDITLPTGEKRILELYGNPIKKNGKNDSILLIGYDITERKLADEELHQIQYNLIEAQRIAKIGSWSWDVPTNRVTWSEAMFPVFGVEPQEPTYDFVKSLIHPQDVDWWEKYFVEMLDKSTGVFDIDYRIIRPDGNIAWMHNEAEVLQNDNGEPIKLIGTTQDITETKLAEKTIRENEERLRLAADAAGFGIWDLDLEHNFLLWDEWMYTLYGINPKKFSNAFESWQAGVHPDDLERATEEVDMAIAGKKEFNTEFRVVRPDGDVRYIKAIAFVHKDAKNKPVRMIGINYDITERKVFEAQIKESEERYRGLVDTLNSGVAVYSVQNDGTSGSEYIIQDFNKFALKHEQLEKKDVIGKSLKDIRPNIDEYGLIDIFRKVWKTGEAAFFPAKVYVDSKYSNYYENRVFRLKSGEIVAVYDDVSDRENAYAQIKESKERFDLAMNVTKDGLYDLNLETNEVYYSPAWKSMLGYQDDELPNDLKSWEKLSEPEEFQKCRIMQQELINKQRDRFEIEFKMKHKEGRWIDIFSRAEAVFDAGNKAVRIVGTNVDITDRKQAENELRVYREHLEELVKKRTADLETANQELESFAYSVSHDLRAPLRAINGFSQYVEKYYSENLDERGKRYISIIRENTTQMDQLIADLLKLSRTARAKFDFEPVDMRAIVKSVYKEIALPQELAEFQFIVADLPAARADAVSMKQLWTNLIGNALKYSSNSAIKKIEIGSIKDEQTNTITYFIKDYGSGFDCRYKAKLFGVFERLHKGSEFPGTGVGLAIVKRIVDKHNGKIWAESEPGKGATFYFSLPKN